MYAILQDRWVEALGMAKDTKTKACIIGVQVQMQRFNIFGIIVGEMILRHSDLLNQK